MPALMVQGCTSWAGKSLLTTALCRWFARQGVSVAPFKAQNMSNNARVVAGGEIGVAQWLQARAAGVEPDVRMNPVLLKPEAGGSQVVMLGQVDPELSRQPWRDRSERLWPVVEAAFDELSARFDVVVIEGAGSPAEINLAGNDIVNMRMAEHAGAAVLLVVDIDRGGAFAHLYGTWALLPERQRSLIRGFVLNRFRGDAGLLPPGPEDLEQLTGVPTVGVVPMLEHDLPDEDGAATRRAPRRGGLPPVAIVRYPAASNLDEFTALEEVAELRWVTEPWHVDGAAIIVLPGSKHVTTDMSWLRTSGLAASISAAAAAGTRVIGVCGGLQMLGESIADPQAVEGTGGTVDGLGLLPVGTVLHPDKRTVQRSVRWPDPMPDPWTGIAGREVTGYEIRHGRSTITGPVDAALDDAIVVAQGNVAGWYLHGALADPDLVHALVGTRPTRTLEQTFDRLADAVDEHLDTRLLRKLVGWP